MPNKHVPGCDCCEANCTAFKDSFNTLSGDWTEDAGDWSIDAGKLTTSDSDAEIRYTAGFTGSDFRVKFKASEGDEVFLASDASTESRDWLIITVGAGGKIQLFSDTVGGSHLYHECAADIPADEWVTLGFRCNKFVTINGVEVFRVKLHGFRPIVLGTGTIADPVYFDDYEQRHVYDVDDHPNCPTCGGSCAWFPNGEACPITFEIAGATDRWNGTYWEYYSRLNGTYEAAELNTPSSCLVQISGLDIDVVEHAGSERTVTAMQVNLDTRSIQLIRTGGLGYFTYDKNAGSPGDYCSGSTMTLADNSPSLTEVGAAIIDVP